MKRNLIVALTLVALSLLTVSTSFAQDRVKANVPFAFQVGKSSLPAGTYVVSRAADHAILIQSRDARSASLSTYSSEEKLRAQSPKMIFHKYGNSYFLAEIWDGSGSSGMQIPETKREKELRASNEGPASEEFVVVAMK
jgi:hypothetical protein